MHAHLGTYLPNFTTAIRDHTNVERIIMSQLRLRMVRPWPDQPDRFRRLWWGEGRGRKGEEEGEEKKRREGGEGGGREEGGEKKEERGKEGRGGRWEIHVQWSGKWKGR